MAVRSRLLFQQPNKGVGTHTLYTCPAGRTAIIRSLVIVNQGSVTVTIRLRCGPGVTPGYIQRKLDIVTLGDVWMTDDVIMNPLDNFVTQIDTAGANVTFSAYGSLLLGEPE